MFREQITPAVEQFLASYNLTGAQWQEVVQQRMQDGRLLTLQDVYHPTRDPNTPENKDQADAVLRKGADAGVREDPRSALFLFEYADGFQGAQFLFPVSDEIPITIAVGLKLKQQKIPIAIEFEMRTEPRYPQFAYLLKAIETMIHTGRPSYPVQRTLLTSGILDRALTSRAAGGQRLATPELSFAYKPVDYPYAPQPDLLAPVATGK